MGFKQFKKKNEDKTEQSSKSSDGRNQFHMKEKAGSSKYFPFATVLENVGGTIRRGKIVEKRIRECANAIELLNPATFTAPVQTAPKYTTTLTISGVDAQLEMSRIDYQEDKRQKHDLYKEDLSKYEKKKAEYEESMEIIASRQELALISLC